MLAAAALSAAPAVADETGSPSPEPGATANELERVAPLVQPSIVYETITWSGYVYETAPQIREYLDDGNKFTVTMQCTGYVVHPDGWIGTAGHCVDPVRGKEAVKRAAAEWAVETGYYSQDFSVDALVGESDTFRVDILDEDDSVVRNSVDRAVTVAWGGAVSGVAIAKRKPARVAGFQLAGQGDAGLLRVDATGLNAIPLAPADSDAVINSSVVAVGFPAVIDGFTDPDLTPTFNNGTVSSTKTIGNELLSVYQLSAPIRGGMSGGPTVDSSGQVIGTNSSSFDTEPFNYAIPSDLMLELMAGSGVENTLSPTTQQYRDGIEAYFDGDKTTAVENLSAVVEEQPANEVAADYLDQAEALPDPEPPPADDSGDGTSTTLLVVGIVLAVLLLGGVAAFFLVRRRRPTEPAPAGDARPRPEPADAPRGAAPTEPVSVQSRVAETRAESTPAGTAAPLTPIGFAHPAGDDRSADGTGTTVMGGPGGEQGVRPAGAGEPAGQGVHGRFCGECGAAAEPAQKFCVECGSRL